VCSLSNGPVSIEVIYDLSNDVISDDLEGLSRSCAYCKCFHKNSSGDEIGNVNFFYETSYM